MGNFKNSTFMFLLGGGIAGFITIQSIVFLVKAWRQGKRLGLTTTQMRRVVMSSSIFTIVPSISILLGVITLSGALGVALPWIRECLIGAITYELPAAQAAAAAFGTTLGSGIEDPVVFSAIAWVMTLGSLVPMVLIPIFLKKLQSGVSSMQLKDAHWTDLLLTAMFIGLISSFLGQSLSGGTVAVLTLFSSAVIMLVLGLIIKKAKASWLENFALPITMLGGMALSVLYTFLLK